MPHLVSTHCIEPHFLRNVLDVLIIGTGTAGLSAALALGRAQRSAIVFDGAEHRNNLHGIASQAISKSIQDETIAEIKAKFKTIMLSLATAASIREKGMTFEVEDVTGRRWKGRKVILAMSSRDALPDIPGYEEALGKHIFDVSQCLDVSNKATAHAAVLITSDSSSSIEAAVLSAHLARQFSPDITFLTNGLFHVEHHPQILATKNCGFKLDNRPIRSLQRLETSVAIQFADGTESVYGLISHKPRKVLGGPFSEQLDLEMTSEGRILVENEFQETSTRGVYAVGDSASFLKEGSAGASAGWLAGVGANLQIAEDDMKMLDQAIVAVPKSAVGPSGSNFGPSAAITLSLNHAIETYPRLSKALHASGRVTLAVRSAAFGQSRRGLATAAAVTSASRSHKVVVIGGGSAGLAISHQLLRSGRFASEDIAVVDPAQWHHYQPGWTLVGAGLKTKEELKMSMSELIDPKLKFYNVSVDALTPEDNSITLGTGDKVNYEHLVVAPGIKINYDSIKGLPEALAERNGPVSSIYGYDYCDKVFPNIQRLQKGNAIFTQPAGVIKCAGAPQKSMWLALDHWKQTGLYDPKNPSASPIKITFATGLPVMFGVPKYSAELEKMRQERGVEGLFQHDLVAIEGNNAVFAHGQDKVTKPFDFLHVVPKMGPHAFVKKSALANEAGYVDVNDNTLRHNKFANVWSAGDASSLPTSKTAAAVTSEAPVLVSNLLRAIDGQEPEPAYDGYTSCPLLTEYGKVMLAEFKYGGVPKETFGEILGIDQAVPRRSFYHLKKDFFPWVYKNYMVKGTWGGPKGWIK
ncbi:uncharacterized protein FOBCDRAFT_146751 [Fusarium oxysporum Fo47]|uniref:uncharacterized protein n=1 Tax=Fusarium oxysporum Fo47 TaxID=660027 RepID=UPI00286996D8|nr:uncharacterized protein FOBCDRAFT_146751 [Fusarium oxysporum Fo47]WJG36943.1 hypothetical protein FOBCDRAFT_146751 [Fusarium oxysporum Fo47]